MRIQFMSLVFLVLPVVVRADTAPDPVKAAIEKGLRRIEQGAANYPRNRDCFSCHHQAMAILSLTSARQRGFAVKPDRIKEQVDFTVAAFEPKKDKLVKGQGIPGGNTMAAYALHALEAGDRPADATTAALVEYLLVRQRADGSWPALTSRPPTEGSTFTNNALALRGLRTYGPPKRDGNADELSARVETAFKRGRDWLLNNKPAGTEDKAFRLRGLVQAAAPPDEIAAARDLLLREQRHDGSWSQLTELEGDAYATGSVLMALRDAGLPASDVVYLKAMKYLLATQKDDGAWIVQTRSRPVQVFFDNGDPGGKSQFISFVATSWAVLALLETYPRK